MQKLLPVSCIQENLMIYYLNNRVVFFGKNVRSDREIFILHLFRPELSGVRIYAFSIIVQTCT